MEAHLFIGLLSKYGTLGITPRFTCFVFFSQSKTTYNDISLLQICVKVERF